MKTETYKKLGEKFSRLLLSLICFSAYLFFFIAMLADLLNTRLDHFLFG